MVGTGSKRVFSRRRCTRSVQFSDRVRSRGVGRGFRFQGHTMELWVVRTLDPQTQQDLVLKLEFLCSASVEQTPPSRLLLLPVPLFPQVLWCSCPHAGMNVMSSVRRGAQRLRCTDLPLLSSFLSPPFLRCPAWSSAPPVTYLPNRKFAAKQVRCYNSCRVVPECSTAHSLNLPPAGQKRSKGAEEAQGGQTGSGDPAGHDRRGAGGRHEQRLW